MPERIPFYKYELHSFEAKEYDSIQEILEHKNLDYRDIISITWEGYYRVFYGLKKMY